MNVVVIILLPLLKIALAQYQDEESEPVDPTRIRQLQGCVSTAVFFPMPVPLKRNSEIPTSDWNKIVLTFHFKNVVSSKLVATIDSQRGITPGSFYKDRLTISKEFSGVFLKDVSFNDEGLYGVHVQLADGFTWTRKFNLSVSVMALVVGRRLNISQSDPFPASNGQGQCVSISCGVVQFQGVPAAMFIWKTSTKVIYRQKTEAYSSSSVQVCTPFVGDVTCLIGGKSSQCGPDHSAVVYVELPGNTANSSSTYSAMPVQNLVLVIVMPILAILVPLTILGIWVLSHLFKSYPQYREHRHYEKEREQKEKEQKLRSRQHSIVIGLSELPPPPEESNTEAPPPVTDSDDIATTDLTNNSMGDGGVVVSNIQVVIEDEEEDEDEEDEIDENTEEKVPIGDSDREDEGGGGREGGDSSEDEHKAEQQPLMDRAEDADSEEEEPETQVTAV